MLKKIRNRINEIFNIFKDFTKFHYLLKNTNKKIIILISHSGDSNGGAPVVIFEYAKYLLDSKDDIVIFLSDRRGDLIYEGKKLKINTFETSFLYKLYLKEIEKKENLIEYIIINTLELYNYIDYLSRLKYKGNIIWWIHESVDLINYYKKFIRKKYTLNNLSVCCVSEQVIDNVKKIINPGYKLFLLPYGLKDLGFIKDNNNQSHFVISIIGRICSRKNQIELLKAYNALSVITKKNIFIRIVSGSADKPYLNKLKEFFYNENISIEGPIPRIKMKKIYKNSDLIVCCSSDDPLPVVVSEALMFGRLCIISSGAGQYGFIKEGVDGFKYRLGDYKSLSEKIEYIYSNFSKFGSVRKEARKLFIANFSLNSMNTKLNKILQRADDNVF